MKDRITVLRKLLEERRLEGCIFANEINILYLTSFLGGARLLTSTQGSSTLFVHGVNYEAAKKMAENCEVQLIGRGENVDLKVAEEIKKLALKRVGFDSLDAPTYLKLRKVLEGIELSSQSNLIWELRKTKDENELKFMRKAAKITDAGMREAYEIIKPGLREREVAAEIEYAMRKMGSDGVAFDTIVASGARSAFPHGGCTERKIREGDLVVIDIGARYRYYRSDLTRTIVVGRPSAKQAKVFEVVKEAQERAFQAVCAGVKARDVDAVARTYIKEAGYDKFFVHGLGHGIGLEVHEPPTLNPESKDTLKEGNVVTVEPGIYIPRFGGVRIEDTVLVCKDGAERLTKAPKILNVE